MTPAIKRSWRIAAVAAVAVIVAALFVAGLALTSGGGGTAQDTEYLKNFRLGETPAEQLAIERAAGVEGPINIPPDNLPKPDDKPVLFGPFYLVPEGWIGAKLERVRVTEHVWDFATAPKPTEENIRASDLWREPSALPPGFDWRLDNVWSEGIGLSVWQEYRAPRPVDPSGQTFLDFMVSRPQSLPIEIPTWGGEGANIFVTTTIDGMPAVLWHAPDRGPGPIGVTAWIFDEPTGIAYVGMSSGDIPVDDVVDAVRSLIR